MTTHHHQLNTNTTLTSNNPQATQRVGIAMATTGAGTQGATRLESVVSFFLFSFFYYTNVYFSLDLRMDNGLG